MEINELSAGHVQDRLKALGASWSWVASSSKRDIICNTLVSMLCKELWQQAHIFCDKPHCLTSR